MARTDTGLGWNAKSDYIMSANGIMGNMRENMFVTSDGPSYASDPSATTLTTNGIHVGQYSTGSECYAAWERQNSTLPRPNYKLCLVETSTSGYTHRVMYFWADPPGTGATGTGTCGYCVMTPRSGSGIYKNSMSYANHDSDYNLYYHGGTSIALTSVDSNINVFATLTEALAYYAGSPVTYYKLNSGYAVACFATYTDSATGAKTTPILISSAEENTRLSTDGVTECPSVMITRLIDGMRFYMRYIPGASGDVSGTLSVVHANLPQSPPLTPSGAFALLVSLLWANINITESVDPYGGGNTENAGGEGEPESGEDIPVPDVPTITSTGSGFLTLFVPSMYDINRLAQYMYSSNFDLDTFKKIFANPIDNIIGLYINAYHASPIDTKEVVVGGIGTGITLPYTDMQFRQLSMGTCTVPREFGSYLDYAPYTKIQVYLPYIGTRELDTDDVMGSTLAITYNIDLLSGACVANISRDNTVLYSFAGQCSAQIPIAAADMRSAFSSAAAVAASLGTAAAAAMTGAGLPFAAGIASASLNVMGTKPKITRSGSIAGAAGFLSPQKPYLIRTNPEIALPTNQNKFTGYPSFITMSLASLTGYNEIASIHLDGVPATDAELSEIVNLLQSGVIF